MDTREVAKEYRLSHWAGIIEYYGVTEPPVTGGESQAHGKRARS